MLPLEDVKIVDFMWALAGPGTTRTLADYGATVVRIESASRIDGARTVGPFYKNKPATDGSGLFGTYNAGKLGLGLDLSKPQARDVVLDLVRWADVVCESFSPKAMRAWKLDYESLRVIKPDLIMLSSCLMGQTGPLSGFVGFGNMAAAISGFYNLCGWPDRAPSGPFGAYTDYIAPRFGAVSVLAAIDYRRRTGKGQYIDQSQAESALHFLSPALLDCATNARVAQGLGNDDPNYAPHGVYPALGQASWVAIACLTEEHWRRLCSVMGRDDLVNNESFAMLSDRHRNRGQLDQVIGAWTIGLTAEAVEVALQAAGIPAAAVKDSRAVCEDEQLASRGYLIEIEHPALGKTVIEGPRFLLSRTPAKVPAPAPTIGGDNQYVLQSILGYDEDRITELVAAGALQ
ncbi:MAG: CoA transferase [Candidatus Binatus sp.]|uniref:CaiB/BaiF CoA transferase family protein n=1 Tax=Candidatus Binatus sp. TaxID=2811406 RepID=UPI00271C703F|nr:CoA transferase [Candidatus Binatus sp.]MDO8432084.1 CoA transferase [Candidatus Binatus sp.]